MFLVQDIFFFLFQISANCALFTTEIETPALYKHGFLSNNQNAYLNDLYSQMRSCDLHHNHIYLFVMPRSIDKQWNYYNSQFKFRYKYQYYSKDVYTAMYDNLMYMYNIIEPYNKAYVEIDDTTSEMCIYDSLKELLFVLAAIHTTYRRGMNNDYDFNSNSDSDIPPSLLNTNNKA